MKSAKLLNIYLEDHHAGATAGIELAKRSLSNNKQGELSRFLQNLVSEFGYDRRFLEDVIESIGGKKSRLKDAGAWTVEKVGRLKLNGSVVRYSDLSRLLELEGLCLGVEGKLSLWRSLNHAAGSDTRLRGFDFERMIQRAQQQREDLEHHRLNAARQALASSGAS